MPRKFDYKPLYNLINRRFGKLTVMKYMGYDMNTTGETRAFHKWLCKCDCGNTKIVQSRNLLNGHCQSCGCLAKNPDPKYTITHGKTNTRLYDIWKNMKGRCYTPSNSGYKHYGARGIQVCDEWKNDFNSFYEWSMNSGYNPNAKRGECTIDRIDVNGNYEPDNCKWVNMIEQANNRTSTKKHFIGGEYLTLREIATNYGIPYKTLKGRIDRGADIETAVYGIFDKNSYLNYNGKELSIMKWSEITGIKPGTIHNRLRRGWDVEKTLCTPVDTSCWNTRKEKSKEDKNDKRNVS